MEESKADQEERKSTNDKQEKKIPHILEHISKNTELDEKKVGAGIEQIGVIASRSKNRALETLGLAETKDPKKIAELMEPKNEARSLDQEKEELRNERMEFERQLDKKIKREEANNPYVKTSGLERKTIVTDEESLKDIINQEVEDKPEAILERVETAAEHDVPIEKLYEKRHEKKDSSNDQSVSAKFAHIDQTNSDVRQYQKQSVVAPNDQPRSSVRDKLKNSAKSAKSNQPELYRRAVVSGFWTAIVFLVAIIILILVS